MDRDELRNRVLNILKKVLPGCADYRFFHLSAEMQEKSVFAEELEIDYLDEIELIGHLETELDVCFPEFPNSVDSRLSVVMGKTFGEFLDKIAAKLS